MDNRGSHVSPKKLLSTEDAHYHGNPPWSKPREQRTVGCPTPADTSEPTPKAQRTLREKGREMMRAGGPGHLLPDGVFYM